MSDKCEVCSGTGEDSPVRVWNVCGYRFHAMCVMCLRKVQDDVAHAEDSDTADRLLLVADAALRHAENCGRLDSPYMLRAEELRDAQATSYAFHRKAMLRIKSALQTGRATDKVDHAADAVLDKFRKSLEK